MAALQKTDLFEFVERRCRQEADLLRTLLEAVGLCIGDGRVFVRPFFRRLREEVSFLGEFQSRIWTGVNSSEIMFCPW